MFEGYGDNFSKCLRAMETTSVNVEGFGDNFSKCRYHLGHA